MDDWNVDLDWNSNKNTDIDKKNNDDIKTFKRLPRASLLVRKVNTIYRKAYSELSLIDIMPKEFKDGDSIICLSNGDVDALSYLKIMIRQQDIEHLILSTWCIAMDDILQIEEWMNDGKIKRIDVYLGEIFRQQYPNEYKKLKEIIEHNNGIFCIYRNHAKIFSGYGEKFYFGIAMSCNINTNPRAENSNIVIGKDTYDFYKDYYSKIKSIDKE